MAHMTKVRADTLKVGDVIMPPAREVQLWMRREIERKKLPESALHLTITAIDEAMPDKKGRWLMVTTQHAAEWYADICKPYLFKFKARPDTPWPKVA